MIKTVITSKNFRSHLVRASWVITGAASAPNPRTRRLFAKFEPSTFPQAMPGLCCNTAFTETSNSGADVPPATITKATMRAGILNRSASPIVPGIKITPPPNSKANPQKIMNRLISIKGCLYIKEAQCKGRDKKGLVKLPTNINGFTLKVQCTFCKITCKDMCKCKHKGVMQWNIIP